RWCPSRSLSYGASSSSTGSTIPSARLFLALVHLPPLQTSARETQPLPQARGDPAGVRATAVVKLVLHSSNTRTKEAPVVPVGLGRPAPDPGLGAGIGRFRGDAGCLCDLGGIGEALAGERLPPEEPPPAVLEIEPARPGGDEDVVEAGMRGQ